jgi:hypothetical protein
VKASIAPGGELLCVYFICLRLQSRSKVCLVTLSSFSSNVMRQPERRSMLANEENKRRLGEDRAKDDDLG